MRKLIGLLFVASALLSFTSSTVFPTITCKDLHDKVVELPKDIKGKKSVLVLAGSKKTEQELEGWIAPLYKSLLMKQTGMFASEPRDVNVYFIPVFSGVNKAAAETVKNKMLKGMDPKLQEHVLIYKGKADAIYGPLALSKKEAEIIVLDKEGVVLKKISGAYSDEKLEQIESALDE